LEKAERAPGGEDKKNRLRTGQSLRGVGGGEKKKIKEKTLKGKDGTLVKEKSVGRKGEAKGTIRRIDRLISDEKWGKL